MICLKFVILPDNSKKQNVIPDHIRKSKQLMKKPFLPGNLNTYNMHDKPKISIFMSENIRQKGLKILGIFRCVYLSSLSIS